MSVVILRQLLLSHECFRAFLNINRILAQRWLIIYRLGWTYTQCLPSRPWHFLRQVPWQDTDNKSYGYSGSRRDSGIGNHFSIPKYFSLVVREGHKMQPKIYFLLQRRIRVPSIVFEECVMLSDPFLFFTLITFSHARHVLILISFPLCCLAAHCKLHV